MKQTVAVTGATGFLGSHLLDALLLEGYRIRALTRKNQEPRIGIEWIRGDLSDPAAMAALSKNTDIVIHAAGLTKARSRSEFFQVNRDGTERLLKCARDNGVKRFLLISSLAAREPHLSHYAASKAAAEGLIINRDWPFDCVVMRPPGIYGPGDMEILKILKATKFGILPAPGSIKNRFAMIHASDLAKAISVFIASSSFHDKPIVEIDDGKENGYNIPEVAASVASATNKKMVKCFSIPRWALKSIAAANLLFSKLISSTPMLTPAKATELSHTDWTVSEEKKITIDGWQAQHDLTSGLKNTIEWYRQHKYL